MALPTPSFIERDAQTIIDEMVADYEARTGKTIQPAQVERLLIDAFAYRELLIRNAIQDAALQNLVSFARYPALDYLGELLGVTRLSATAASCTLRFTIVQGHTGVVVPSGTRVATTDGKAVFETVESIAVAQGVFTGDVEAVCQSLGDLGNGYAIGYVSTLMDPLAFVEEVSNLGETGGGSEQESDDQLRERIKAAPFQFSNAGSKGAYIYWAKSAHPSIIDVAVESSTPGQVDVYPLVAGGTASQEILDAVTATLSDETVRPLTDTVVVANPTVVNYDIAVDLVLYQEADEALVVDAVTAALDTYADAKAAKLGQDIVLSQIVAAASVDGVYSVTVTDPATDEVIDASEVAIIGTITVNVTGTTNG